MPSTAVLLALVLVRAQLGMAAAPTEIHREGYCSFYGDCGKNPEIGSSLLPGNTVPCVSNTPARQISGLHLQRLRSLCPALFTGTENTLACCSEAQLEAVERSLRISQVVLTRCPACAENFANLYCQNICSPNQSVFTNVTRTFSLTTTNGSLAVGVLEYQCYYSQAFADATYDSCKGVRIPATGGYAIGAMCGKYGAALCNTQRWLDYQGDSSNGLAPLAISYHLVPGDSPAIGGGIMPFNGLAWQCSEPVGNGTGEKCSCQDCAQSCPAITAPSPPVPPFQVRGLNGALFVCIILFCVLVVAFVAALLWRSCSSSPPEKPKESGARMSCCKKLSQGTDKFLARAFSRWGMLVASYPRTVILISVAVVLVLSSGLGLIQLTTDPVELWSSPDSQARQEKAFYEKNFGPFFRTNQAILTARNRSSYTYDSLVMGRTNFSGILSLEVLMDLLELQRRVQSITVWSAKHHQNVSLQDVCYAPLNPQNATLTDCALNSLLQYFQNNQTRLEMTASQTLKGETGTVDWRDHFLYCINSPLSFKDITALELSCMADYGAPVFPFLAVGGYAGVAYSEAQALILTVSLNNFPSSDRRFDFVMLWEKQFLNVLQEFQQEYADRYTVAYMAERSLEDEISRSTWEDLPVFAVSYLLVFVYIALALGQYSSCKRIPETPASTHHQEPDEAVEQERRIEAAHESREEPLVVLLGSPVFVVFQVDAAAHVQAGGLQKSKVPSFKGGGWRHLPLFRRMGSVSPFSSHRGLGAYDTSVKLGPEGQVLASRFMAYHTPLKNSQEYTAALKVARELATNITASMREVPGTDPDFQVFPYTITYVFYEQYLTIAMTGIINVILCLVPTFLVCYILLGMDLRSAAINLVTIVMIVVDTVGAMTLWGVSFNAISLINLVAAVGISVEFVSHITRFFAVCTLPTKVERAKEATVNMGSAVFAGVAMTNLPGVVVLAFAKTQLVQLFFFRLNLLITLLGMLHGLVFLPVILSYFGPEVRLSVLQVQREGPQQESPTGATRHPMTLEGNKELPSSH
ncbi:hypothetical protein JD844_030872 [Phrynosoma platyrhinos]|uniref:Uncharacterized protein n=1 Tax=Phrynosoma platyrhinos TaxID=52577 RepID=A0ABQ7T084_PHRPL|nr:hypothetical protein JD844_030872 [Phrynosoma platyrhinos]